MAESDTLLANLAWRFPGNREDIATEALKHILEKSDASMDALNDIVRSGVKDVKAICSVATQVTSYRDGSRPDLIGKDEEERERVIVEVKFDAVLTRNQPNTYIERLPHDGPAVLLFLVPEDRVQILWPELIGRAEQNTVLHDVHSERKCFRLGDTERHLMVVSWTGLLDSMAARSWDAEEPASIGGEIRQLRTLSKYASAGTFQPIRQGKELGDDPDALRNQLKMLIDDATNRAVEQGWASKKGLRATPRTYGYGRYVRLNQGVIWFGINWE